MSTFKQRLDKTLDLLNADVVEPSEVAGHLYYFLRFELAYARRNRAVRKMTKYKAKLDTNLEVFGLRLQMTEL